MSRADQTSRLPVTAYSDQDYDAYPRAAAPRRRRGCGVVVGLLVLLVVLAVGAVGAELGVRHSIGGELERSATAQLGSPAHVSFGTGIVATSLLTHSLPSVRLTAPGSDQGTGPNGVSPQVDITATDVTRTDDGARAGHMQGTITLTDEQLASAASNQLGGGGGAGGALGGFTKVSDMQSHPENGTLTASVGGLAQVTVHPTLTNGKVSFDTENASIFGFQIPNDILGGSVGAVDAAASQLPEGMTMTAVHVVPGGLTIDVSGDNVLLKNQG